MKKLSAILNAIQLQPALKRDLEIDFISNNSRSIVKNTLFLAYPGEKVDGRHYIVDAVQKGVAAIFYEPSFDFVLPDISVPCFAVKNLKIKQSHIAAFFYDDPSTKIPVIGVTGTNGKTSVTHFIAQCLDHCAVVGTVGYGFLSELNKIANTTPDGLQLQTIFSSLISHGAKAIAMEVSSHALVQQRVNDVLFHTAVFTNLTQDHLDYHGSMEDYRDAKALLFQHPGLKNAVINIDDDAGKYYIECIGDRLKVITYSQQDKKADIYVEKYLPTEKGFDLALQTPWGAGTVHVPLIGEFQIANTMAVIGVLGLLNISFNEIIKKISGLRTVNGRMELLSSGHSNVLIDYAHTPDALEKALKSTRSHCSGKLICVFGCGGDRDKTKRPIMGKIAEQFADEVIITNDNPRNESPEAIAQDILAGVTDKNKIRIELNRVHAIEKAILAAQKNDWILIAGKGHETEQIMGDTVYHHSDAECVKTIFENH